MLSISDTGRDSGDQVGEGCKQTISKCLSDSLGRLVSLLFKLIYCFNGKFEPAKHIIFSRSINCLAFLIYVITYTYLEYKWRDLEDI